MNGHALGTAKVVSKLLLLGVVVPMIGTYIVTFVIGGVGYSASLGTLMMVSIGMQPLFVLLSPSVAVPILVTRYQEKHPDVFRSKAVRFLAVSLMVAPLLLLAFIYATGNFDSFLTVLY